ncbi:hypothetical protein B296_00052396 [Ensete ventricosum]|uniref:Uncharacterized protein n=1 Tax=Ensete ventricosum TaxID=4639 RepID=A0A426YCJ7_ENSVE|nr:hypothetical protein B296_00052396 [Ensete ventricosum]
MMDPRVRLATTALAACFTAAFAPPPGRSSSPMSTSKMDVVGPRTTRVAEHHVQAPVRPHHFRHRLLHILLLRHVAVPIATFVEPDSGCHPRPQLISDVRDDDDGTVGAASPVPLAAPVMMPTHLAFQPEFNT